MWKLGRRHCALGVGLVFNPLLCAFSSVVFAAIVLAHLSETPCYYRGVCWWELTHLLQADLVGIPVYQFAGDLQLTVVYSGSREIPYSLVS